MPSSSPCSMATDFRGVKIHQTHPLEGEEASAPLALVCAASRQRKADGATLQGCICLYTPLNLCMSPVKASVRGGSQDHIQISFSLSKEYYIYPVSSTCSDTDEWSLLVELQEELTNDRDRGIGNSVCLS